MYEKNKTLIIKAQNGDKKALEELIKENNGLIWSIVKRFIGRGVDKDDLYQIGCIGFIKAIQRFNFEFEVQLSTYAVQYMLGEIKKFLRDDGIIKVSRSIKELGVKIKELEKEYIAREGERLSIKKIAEILNASEEDICIAIESDRTIESINETMEDGDCEKIDRIIIDTDEQNKLIDKIAILELIKALDIRDREIINLRYFKEKTQIQVAKIMGISQVQVSRLEKKILTELKNKLVV